MDKATYQEAKELAQSKDVNVRAELAARKDLPPELLYFLAGDQSADVRRAVAANDSAPRQTDLILAQDKDADVRGDLASKIAKVAPGLSNEETNKIKAQTYEALETLAQDQLVVVRAALSEALKDVADAPHDLIRRLARDLAVEVSGPVLEFSPVLTESDLIEIIDSTPESAAVAAVARRSDVTENLADAIIETDDLEGVADLLGNGSAQIREEALDDLISRSQDVELWQAPLVSRPKLPGGAAQRMAGFLAKNLVDQLRQRTDLDSYTIDAVSNILNDRFGSDGSDGAGGPNADNAVSAGFDFLKVEPPVATAERLQNAGKLSNDVVVKALRAGDHSFVFAALIVRSKVAVPVATRIFMERNPKAIVALIAKADLPSSIIVTTQQQMGRIAPSEIVHPDGTSMPLSKDEIDWQLEFFADLAERG